MNKVKLTLLTILLIDNLTSIYLMWYLFWLVTRIKISWKGKIYAVFEVWKVIKVSENVKWTLFLRFLKRYLKMWNKSHANKNSKCEMNFTRDAKNDIPVKIAFFAFLKFEMLSKYLKMLNKWAKLISREEQSKTPEKKK